MSCQKGYVVILTFWKPDWDWIENDALFSLKASHIFFCYSWAIILEEDLYF